MIDWLARLLGEEGSGREGKGGVGGRGGREKKGEWEGRKGKF